MAFARCLERHPGDPLNLRDGVRTVVMGAVAIAPGIPEVDAAGELADDEQVECWLEDKHVTPEDPLDYLATSALGPHLARLPDAQAQPFIDAVAERMPSPLSFDYVRLNINARRARAA